MSSQWRADAPVGCGGQLGVAGAAGAQALQEDASMTTTRLPFGLLILTLATGLPGPVLAQGSADAAATARAELKDAKGQVVGRAALTDTPHGVLVHLTFTNAPAGVHAFHIHQTGKCDPPAFETAGSHFNPAGAQHGLKNPKGAHAGDLPNVIVPAGGTGEAEVFAAGVRLTTGDRSLLDADGASLMLHVAADNHLEPTTAGARLACGVIMK